MIYIIGVISDPPSLQLRLNVEIDVQTCELTWKNAVLYTCKYAMYVYFCLILFILHPVITTVMPLVKS